MAIALGGSCALCSVLGLGVTAFGLLSDDSATSTSGGPHAASGHLPTGETPNLYPGTPGWLPSGRGVPIPPSEVSDEGPRGLWWCRELRSDYRWAAVPTLFLGDGIRATHPRPGSGTLYDLEGQRAQPGTTGVGTFTLADGAMTQVHDGFTSTDPFQHGSNDHGPWFELGKRKYLPLAPATREAMIGQWSTGGGRYVFHDDGTFEMGVVSMAGEFTLAAGGRGTWELDGHLLALRPTGAPSWITTIGATGSRYLVIGDSIYDRD